MVLNEKGESTTAADIYDGPFTSSGMAYSARLTPEMIKKSVEILKSCEKREVFVYWYDFQIKCVWDYEPDSFYVTDTDVYYRGYRIINLSMT